ncbi:glycosyltransferase family 2 protein [Puniceicoccales bacterium CK1056]|uniref:Glycosyltransferase family 2 protein n=1 Tax=Oceanipulchritudo coccoides TaxID=2706888 RepID=A0A6B2M4Y8_9BACT|nr:glycosyltransferase family 2 protein [Oceanipulchritudo coccoides]NDV62700.1 glycosyltransferase family 2 protein [Oceanipulchritudo coccoides]
MAKSTKSSKGQAPRPEISVITPFYNEASGVERFMAELTEVLIGEGLDYEIICVDDGSSDLTLPALLKARESNRRVRIIQLSRNFGKEVALTAGLDHARGQAVIPMDADLQDPPRLIPHLVSRWRDGYQVVNAHRAERISDSWMKRNTAKLFYKVFNAISETPIPENTGDFRLMDREVVEALRCMPERDRFMKGLFAWVGYRTTEITYERPARATGESKWNYWKLFNFAVGGVTAFSTFPLRLFNYIGLAVASLSFLYASLLVIRTLFLGRDVPGYASIMVVILFLGGIQLIGIGVVGEYIGRVFIEVKERPLYLVHKVHGFDEDLRGNGS